MTSELQIPKQADREYFRAFGIVALFVAASPTRVPCLIGYTRDLGSSLESIRARWHWSIGMTHAWWMANQRDARRVLDAVNAVYPVDSRGLFDVEADRIAAKLEHAATTYAVTLTPHADAMHRVQLAVARVDVVIEQANTAGELRWFNRAYRAWRTARPVEVAAALPYALARTRLRAAMVRRIAKGLDPLSPDLLPEVFPPALEGKGHDASSMPSTGADSPDHAERTGGRPNGKGSTWYPAEGSGP